MTAPVDVATIEIDGFVTLTSIAEANDVEPRTVNNWRRAGTFPEPDGVINGRPVWLRSTYRRWREQVIEGRYAGRDRLAHLRKTAAA